MKIRFIINPKAGTGKHKGIEDDIALHLKEYDIIYTKRKGDANIISKEAVEQKIDAVVVIGGDGTLNECLKPLTNTNTALGIIPCGSGNGFAYHIGMKRSNEEAIKQLKNVKIEKIDTCLVNDRAFANISGIGFDAHIANKFAKLKKRGFISYVRLIIMELSYKAEEYIINYDGIERRIAAYMISFANASQYGNDAKISPHASIQDGLIDFVILKKIPKWKIPLLLVQMLNGRIHLSKYIEIIKSKQMQITAKNKLIHLDGEPYMCKKPINVNILENSLKILMPNEKK